MPNADNTADKIAISIVISNVIRRFGAGPAP